MNKKIKIIELWNINAQIEDANKLPQRIKYEGSVYELQMSRDYFCEEKDAYLTKEIDSKQFNIFLNDYVEILEDNTEEIKKNTSFEQMGYDVGKITMEIAKGFEKAINELRKEN